MLREPDPSVRAREQERVSFKTLVDGEEVLEEDIGMPEVEFTSLELPGSGSTAESIVDYDTCLVVWKKCSHWFTVAKEHFQLDGFVTDHLDIVQDLSRSYKMLAYYDKDPSRKSKMYKRRLDLLAPVEEIISPAVYAMQSKQLAWELSEIHDAMFDFKLNDALNESPTLDAARRKKLLNIALKSVFMLTRFVGRFHNEGDPADTPLNDVDEVEWFLMGQLSIARMHGKVATVLDREGMIEQIKTSLEKYIFIVAYCDKNNELCSGKFVQELEICREMVALLPQKLDQIASQGWAEPGLMDRV